MSRFLGMAVMLLVTMVAVADLSGVWTLTWEPDFGGHQDAYDCKFKHEGRLLTIHCREDAPMSGEVDGQKVMIRFKTGREGNENATLIGNIDERGTRITGTWHLVEQNRDGKFTATKQ